jgi:uncharacterized repeat protein (TIGR02543 family)
MNITLTAMTAAVVTACFVTTGVKEEAPVFPIETVNTTGQIEIAPALNIHNSVNLVISGGVLSITFEEKVVVASETINTVGVCEASLKYYDLQSVRAYYGGTQSQNIKEVAGYYNGRVVFGIFKNTNILNLKNTVITNFGLDISNTGGVGKITQTVSTSLDNIQLYARHINQSDVLNSVLTTLVARDPSNISPYKTLLVHHTAVSNGDSLVPPSKSMTITSVINEASTFGVLEVAPYKLATDFSDVSSNLISSLYHKQENIIELISSLSTFLNRIEYFVIAGIEGLHDITTELQNVTVVEGKNLNNFELVSGDFISEAFLSTFFVAGVESFTEVLTENQTAINVKDVVSDLNTLILSSAVYIHTHTKNINEIGNSQTVMSSGQSDIMYGNEIFVSRTENVHTSVESFSVVYNPGVVSLVNETMCEGSLTIVAGVQKELNSLNNTINTYQKLEIAPYKLTAEMINNTVSMCITETVVINKTAETLNNTIASDVKVETNVKVLSTPQIIENTNTDYSVSLVVDRAVFRTEEISTNGFIYTNVINKSIQNIIKNLESFGESLITYQDPLQVSGVVEPLATDSIFNAFSIGNFSPLETVNSNVPNIQMHTMHKDIASVEDNLNTLFKGSLKVERILETFGDLTTVGDLKIDMYVLVSNTDSVTTGAVAGVFHKNVIHSGGLNTLNTSLGNADIVFALYTYSITTSKGTGVDQLSVSPTTYQESASNQTVTITRSALTGYSLNDATVTRLNIFGGTDPTIDGAIVTIPANSWGAFRVNQTASPNSFNITLNPNEGVSGSKTTIAVVYNTSIESFTTSMLSTRTEYTTTGYWTASSGGTQRISTTDYTALTSTTYTNAVTLFAQWVANTYTVTFNANGGGTPTPTSKTVTYASTYGTLATVTRAGYTFNGWWTATSEGTQILSSTVVSITSNQTLFARWTANTFNITLNPNGGTAGSKTTIAVVYNTSIESFSTTMLPTRSEHTFKGFYTATSGGTQRISSTAYVALTSTTYTSAATLFAQWEAAQSAAVWTYIGTSGSQNASVTAPSNYLTCATSGAIHTWLTDLYAPSNYSNGYIMRVLHSTHDDDFTITQCTAYFYRRD